MKGAIILAAAGLVAAQLPDLSNVPQCAITCLLPALSGTGCDLTDLSCACKSENQDKIRSSATPCLEKGCSKEDLQKALDAANSFCGGGVSSIPSGSATATGATSTGSESASTGSESASSGSASESSSAVITSSATPTSGAGGIVPPVTSAVSSGHSTALPGNGTATTHTSTRSASGSSSATSSGSQTSSTAPGTNDAAGPVAGVVAAIAAAVFAL